jgi:hypothetical protein
MSKALSQVIASTVSQSRDASKKHLYPCHGWHRLSNNSVTVDSNLSDLAMESLCNVELEVDSEHNLYNKHKHQDIRKGSMDAMGKDAPLVKMSQEICHHRNCCA